MSKSALDGVFKNTKQAAIAKGDATTRAAREIIEREATVRDAKTARLRAMRLAKEHEDAEVLAAAAPPPPKKKRKAEVKSKT